MRHPKNVVILSDGTGQSYSGAESNVLRLYKFASKVPSRQVVCYDPGLGTHPFPVGISPLARKLRHALELGAGLGITGRLTHLYQFLMRHYEPDDHIILFGFSRGAFTVRALAGLVHLCGILSPRDEHLVPYALGLYLSSEERIRRALDSGACPFEKKDGKIRIDHARLDDEARDFKKLLSQDCKIHFLGIWDTVKAYCWIFPRSFPALRHNPSVESVRHAVALNERRAMFQVTGWGDRHENVREVWFAGDHSDVGGGHSFNSGLPDATLRCMLGEATEAGLLLEEAQRESIDEFAQMAPLAPPAKPNNLLEGWFRFPVPRRELNNESYPPKRPWRCSVVGRREPAMHHEKTHQLPFHHSVCKEQGIDLTSPDCVRWRFGIDLAKSEWHLEYEKDRPITWPQGPCEL